MNREWKNAVITRVALAMYVRPRSGRDFHIDRPYHGLVINDDGGEKDYLFSDGRVMHTRGGEVFYLPKGSTYQVIPLETEGGCYAINFESAIADEPFCMSIKRSEAVRSIFAEAVRAWHGELGHLTAVRAVYDILLALTTEERRRYSPPAHLAVIAPALDKIETDFTDPTLSVSDLAALSGVSEVYLRRLFAARFGMSPKAYILRKRIEYAKQLLSSETFSVNECAALCGYTEPCHFSREFTAKVGLSPTAYKKKREH